MGYLALYSDFSDDFRAENGFAPRVGYRRGYVEVGRTVRSTTGFLRRLRTFLIANADYERDGDLILRRIMPGVTMDRPCFNPFIRFEGQFDEVHSATIRSLQRQPAVARRGRRERAARGCSRRSSLASGRSPLSPPGPSAPDRAVGGDRERVLSLHLRRGGESGLLFFGALRLQADWPSLLFIGYDDSRALDESENLEKAERQFFVKISYAFQM